MFPIPKIRSNLASPREHFINSQLSSPRKANKEENVTISIIKKPHKSELDNKKLRAQSLNPTPIAREKRV